MKNFGISLSKSLTERDSTYEICSSLLSLLGIEEGWIASPDASRSAERRDTSATRSAERRDTSAMDFEDSLPKSDIRHSPEHAIRHGTAKQNPGRNSQVAAVKPNMCLLQLSRFFVGDFGLQCGIAKSHKPDVYLLTLGV